MNPITLVGGVAALAVAGYALHIAYSAGQSNVRAKWDAERVLQQQDDVRYRERISTLQHQLIGSQTEARNAHDKESKVAAELLALQHARSATADGSLRNALDRRTSGLARRADDSAALGECKATVQSLRSVFESCVGRYRELGEAAQQRVADAVSRGFECERSYDAAERSLRELLDQSGVHLDQGAVK